MIKIWTIKWNRFIYTLCFTALCIVDWAKVSLDGRTQMMATNITGLLIALIIFSGYHLKEFFKPIYALWAVAFFIVAPVGIEITLRYIPYTAQVYSGAANIMIYGILLIKVVNDFVYKKRRLNVDPYGLALFVIMMVCMLFSRNEDIWPFWFLIMFGCYYLTQFDGDKERVIYMSAVDGLIGGFFIIQGLALLFRPYDIPRYRGLYINPNMNALFYLFSYTAFLCKWLYFSIHNSKIIYRLLSATIAGSIYGFCLLTGSRSSLFSMFVITIPFVFISLKYCSRKKASFIGYWLTIGVIALLSIPIDYCLVRYVPTIHLHPMYFEGEYNPGRVQPGEARDSEKYVTYERAMETALGRIFYYAPKSYNILGFNAVLNVKAAEIDSLEIDYIFSEEEYDSGIDPFRLRYEIYRYYLKRLNLLGHSNDYEGAPIFKGVTAPHAHNIFIQMSFLYGIPAGVLFLGFLLMFVRGSIKAIKSGNNFLACIMLCYVILFVTFGFLEIDWMCGQLPFTMIFLLYRYNLLLKV